MYLDLHEKLIRRECMLYREMHEGLAHQKGHSQIMLEKSTWLYGLRTP